MRPFLCPQEVGRRHCGFSPTMEGCPRRVGAADGWRPSPPPASTITSHGGWTPDPLDPSPCPNPSPDSFHPGPCPRSRRPSAFLRGSALPDPPHSLLPSALSSSLGRSRRSKRLGPAQRRSGPSLRAAVGVHVLRAHFDPGATASRPGSLSPAHPVPSWREHQNKPSGFA